MYKSLGFKKKITLSNNDTSGCSYSKRLRLSCLSFKGILHRFFISNYVIPL